MTGHYGPLGIFALPQIAASVGEDSFHVIFSFS
jgi:hypothetical protein